MIDQLKPHPEYKDSGHPWPGKSPLSRMTSGIITPALHMDR